MFEKGTVVHFGISAGPSWGGYSCLISGFIKDIKKNGWMTIQAFHTGNLYRIRGKRTVHIGYAPLPY